MKTSKYEPAVSYILKLFGLVFFIVPVCFAVMLMTTIGREKIQAIAGIVLFLAPPLVFTITIIFIAFIRKLDRHLKKIYSEGVLDKEKEAAKNYINSYPRKAAIMILIIISVGPFIVGISGLMNGILFSWQETLFFIFLGQSLAYLAALFMYYQAKIKLFTSINKIEYKPLSFFLKISIPITSILIVLLIFTSCFLYRISLQRNLQLSNKNASIGLQLISTKLELYLHGIVGDLERDSRNKEFNAMDINSLQELIFRLHKKKPEYAEMYQIVDRNGKGVTSTGNGIDISDRLYFKKIMEGEKYAFSDLIASEASGRDVFICAVPVLNGSEVVGLFGIAISVESFNQFIREQSLSEKTQLLVISERDTIIYSRDMKYQKKVIGKDIVDNGTTFKNINQLMSAKDKSLYQSTFGGNEIMGISEVMAISKWRLVLMIEKAEFYSDVNTIMLQIVVLIILSNVIIGALLFKIILKISDPIKNVISIFNNVAAGDITIRIKEYMPDESSYLVISLNKLLDKLAEVAHVSIESSKQLAVSSEGLATSSQDLAFGAQTQAASIEEASASLEELASSIESIAQNAVSQATLAIETYHSMEKLRKIIQTVAEHAKKALENAINSTQEAVKGSDLIQNTIEGMDNIDKSTSRIAEIVVIIHDISDKVHLLALNAAIEAARAGEHGKGFAVVADEIAKLADKTAGGANDIANYIKEGQGEVNRGKQFVDDTAKAFSLIIENIKNTDKHVRLIAEFAKEQDVASESVLNDSKRVKEMSEKISFATKEQGQTNREMLNTIEIINNLTQSVAANAEQIASTSKTIGAQANSLNEEIKFFKV